MTADEWDVCTDAEAMMFELHRPPYIHSPVCEQMRLLALHILKPNRQDIEHFDFFYTPPTQAIAEDYESKRAYYTSCVILLTESHCIDPIDEFITAHHHEANLNRRDKSRDADDIREAVGNPYRPVALNPAWLTSPVVALVSGIREDRAFYYLPILADALEEAGCTNADILNHCRHQTNHHAGCWVLSLLTR